MAQLCPLQLFRSGRGLGHIEIAAEMGIHPSQVEKMIHNLRTKEWEAAPVQSERTVEVQHYKKVSLIRYAGFDLGDRVDF